MEAKSLYLSGFSLTEISEELGIPLQELRRQAFGLDGTGVESGCWLQEKETGAVISPSEFQKVRPILLKRVQAKLMNKIASGVSDISFDEIKDIEVAVNITEKLHKMERLEEGQSTENIDVSSSGFTLREIMAEYSDRREDEDEKILLE
jgi:hypothetical protein